MIGIEEWNSCIIGDCKVSPEFVRTSEYIGIRLSDTYYSCGKWILKMKRKKGCKQIKASANYKIHAIKESKLLCVLRQYDGEDNEICGDYFANRDNKLGISLELSKKTEYFTVEFLFYSFGEAELKISSLNIDFVESQPHRMVNVATTCFKRKFTINCNDNLEEILKILDNASKDELKPDIICFTETAYDRGIVDCEDHKWIDENSEPVKKICEKAKEHNMYIIFSIHELDNGRRYNTDLIISPDGEVIGKYRKTHLTYLEINDGMIPGNELKVFDLPFGRIGILICWDQWFPEAARRLTEQGAEIIFVSTAGDPECIYRARAFENSVYMVVSGTGGGDKLPSCIINQKGDIVSSVTDEDKGYAVHRIDLDEHKYLRYLVFEQGYGANLYPVDRRPKLY